MKKRLLAFPLALLLVGCASPIVYTDQPMSSYDKDTDFAVVDRPGGFTLTINYGRYQFIPESSAVATACRSALTSVAHDLAEKKGRRIEPINEQRIKISMGRNGFTGMTTCSASAPVNWAG